MYWPVTTLHLTSPHFPGCPLLPCFAELPVVSDPQAFAHSVPLRETSLPPHLPNSHLLPPQASAQVSPPFRRLPGAGLYTPNSLSRTRPSYVLTWAESPGDFVNFLGEEDFCYHPFSILEKEVFFLEHSHFPSLEQ